MSDGIRDAMKESYPKTRKEEKEVYFKDLDKIREREPDWFNDYIYSFLEGYDYEGE